MCVCVCVCVCCVGCVCVWVCVCVGVCGCVCVWKLFGGGGGGFVMSEWRRPCPLIRNILARDKRIRAAAKNGARGFDRVRPPNVMKNAINRADDACARALETHVMAARSSCGRTASVRPCLSSRHHAGDRRRCSVAAAATATATGSGAGSSSSSSSSSRSSSASASSSASSCNVSAGHAATASSCRRSPTPPWPRAALRARRVSRCSASFRGHALASWRRLVPLLV